MVEVVPALLHQQEDREVGETVPVVARLVVSAPVMPHDRVADRPAIVRQSGCDLPGQPCQRRCGSALPTDSAPAMTASAPALSCSLAAITADVPVAQDQPTRSRVSQDLVCLGEQAA